uniref:Uncharacterized protein n=1 Tax=Arundo donax TaxID=35708 RepID=A0A0A9F365_ARUDO
MLNLSDMLTQWSWQL